MEEQQREYFDPPEFAQYGGDIVFMKKFLERLEAQRLLKKLLNLSFERSYYLYGKDVVCGARQTIWVSDDDLLEHPYVAAPNHIAGMIPKPWTKELKDLKAKVEAETKSKFNAALVNLYPNGKAGIGWHADRDPWLGSPTIVASLTLGATREFLMRPKKSDVDLMLHYELISGSLLLMRSGTQKHFLHTIPKTRGLHDARINITFRKVRKNLIHTMPKPAPFDGTYEDAEAIYVQRNKKKGFLMKDIGSKPAEQKRETPELKPKIKMLKVGGRNYRTVSKNKKQNNTAGQKTRRNSGGPRSSRISEDEEKQQYHPPKGLDPDAPAFRTDHPLDPDAPDFRTSHPPQTTASSLNEHPTDTLPPVVAPVVAPDVPASASLSKPSSKTYIIHYRDLTHEQQEMLRKAFPARGSDDPDAGTDTIPSDFRFVYVGRENRRVGLGKSLYGNPFRMKNTSNKERNWAVESYRRYFHDKNQADMRETALAELADKTLVCWCAPKACHASVIAEFINKHP